MRKYHGKDLSTNDFTDGYKKKIDSMQTLYRFKGTVDTVNDLSTIEDRNIGDTYKCKTNSNTYIWNGIEWINAGQDVDYSEILEQIDTYQDEVNTQINNIEQEGIIVSPTEPTENRRKVWMQKGKNLLKLNINQTKNGITITTNANGSITLNGTATADTRIDIPINLNLKSGTYTHSKNNATLSNTFFSLDNVNDNMLNSSSTEKTWQIASDTNYKSYVIWFGQGVVFNNTTLYLQLEQSPTATDYEEYIEPKTYILNDNDVYEEFMKKEQVIKYTIGEIENVANVSNRYSLYKKANHVLFYCNSIWMSEIVSNSWKKIGKIPNEIVPNDFPSNVVTVLDGDTGNILGLAKLEIREDGGIYIKANLSKTTLVGIVANLSWCI